MKELREGPDVRRPLARRWQEWQPALDAERGLAADAEAAVERRIHGTSSTSVQRQLDVLAEALGR